MEQNMVGQPDVATRQVMQWFQEHGQEQKRTMYKTGSAILIVTDTWTQADRDWMIALLAVGPDRAVAMDMEDAEEEEARNI